MTASGDEIASRRRSPSPSSAAAAETPVLFTLASALRWLGHVCPGDSCSAPLGAMPASIWFLLDEERHEVPTMRTRVLVDLPSGGFTPDALRTAMSQVNCCARGDLVTVAYLSSPQPSALDDRW